MISINDAKHIGWKILVALLVLGAGGVALWRQHSAETPVKVAFYHWKTVYEPGENSRALLAQSGAQRQYVRVFDVAAMDKDATFMVPAATAVFRDKPLLPVVPVVYIHNRDFAGETAGYRPPPPGADDEPKGKESAPVRLARRIAERVDKIMTHNQLTPAGELQIDCDWTPGTKDAYFGLLAELKKRIPEGWKLSVTIRLHQYRDYAATGVPPVDRVVLMAYNMGDLRRYGDQNSIIDPVVAAAYLKGNDYPLPLDVALALFSWGVIFDETNRYQGLVSVIPPDLNDPKRWEKIGSRLYRLKENAVISGRSLSAGWVLRAERTEQQDLNAISQLLGKSLDSVETVIFYHLDDEVLKGWTMGALSALAKNIE